ncbi:nudix hydrolase 8-like isoform X2 [Tripterygium wilfordii]|uniref:nudix hydrolase 8-like isoform X2 n=1 Tax=Tripterygium wilfordii TaxID=458696 RepID=UPI0018F8200C|nr:nudix hydrolase 8-like isoform X2 [Tripterygium wilfordii]
MEWKILCPKTTSAEIVPMRTTCSSQASSLRHFSGVGFSPQSCSSKGLCSGSQLKVTCSSISTKSQWLKYDSNSADQENPVAGKYVYDKINGSNGTRISLYPSNDNVRVLHGYDDEYGGVVIDPDRLPANTNTFASTLRFSLSHWKTKGKKGIWLKLPVEHSEFVPVAVKEGFQYHHAEKGYVMLTYWLPGGPCLLPANASHQVGVGGFVINERNEVLVVQEKYCAPASASLWKIPTGFILESEEIFTGVVREVKEETGIDTEFVEVVAFRHAHNLAFDKSDLCFVCILRPLSTQIIVDDSEIQDAKWMPLMEFVQQALIEGDSMFKKIVDICIDRLGMRYCGLSAHQVISTFDGKPSSLYYNVTEPQDFNCIGS